MQFIVYFLATLALVAADGYYYETPSTAPRVHWGTLALTQQEQQLKHQEQPQYQYHTQDGYGQYSYGYGEPLSTKQEVRTLDGITRGSYTYLDATGKLQTVSYTADANGFRVTASNLPKAEAAAASVDLPQPVQETPEVAAARIQHLAAHQQSKLRLYEISAPTAASPHASATALSLVKKVDDNAEKRVDHVDIVDHVLPHASAVMDTPEVAAAKVEFFKRFEEVKQRNEKLRQQQQEQFAGYTLVKSPTQPLPVTGPFASYKPNGIFRYDVLVPSRNKNFSPLADLNL